MTGIGKYHFNEQNMRLWSLIIVRISDSLCDTLGALLHLTEAQSLNL